MNANAMGVGPLVCAVCEMTVGAINRSDLVTMLQDEDVYICRACEDTFPATMIETALSQQTLGHYAEVVNKVELVWAAEQGGSGARMNTYIVTVRVTLELDAVDQETAIELAQDAAWRTRFCREYKMVSVREYGRGADGDSRIRGMTGSQRED